MIINDYEKRVLLKLQELEKRMEIIEQEQKEINYQELDFSLGHIESETTVERLVKYNALKEGKVTITGKTRSNVVSVIGIYVKFYVNDVLFHSFICNVDKEFTFTFKPTLVKGENSLKIRILSSVDIDIAYFDFSVNGFVDYINHENNLSIVSGNNIDYVLHQNSNNFDLLTYTESENLVNRCSISNASKGNIVGIIEGYLYIAICNNANGLELVKMDISTFTFEKIDLNVSGVDCVAGFCIDNKIKILFCKLYDLYEGVFDVETNGFTYRNTGKKSIKVYADPNFPNAYVMADRFNNSKLVIE